MAHSEEISPLSAATAAGDHEVLERLAPMLYDDLRRLAHARLRGERTNHTLQTTALVHEAWLRLAGQCNVHWQNRSHLLAIAARLMRRILVDYARKRQYGKRGGGAVQVALDDAVGVRSQRAIEISRLDDALTSLARIDERKGQIVELRFFAGLSIEQTAEVLGVSPGTVMRDWTLAKAYLQREIGRVAGHGC